MNKMMLALAVTAVALQGVARSGSVMCLTEVGSDRTYVVHSAAGPIEKARDPTDVDGLNASPDAHGEVPAKAAPGASEPPPRIGVYDSRSVAAAYCGTPRHEAEIKRLDDALKKAKASADSARIQQADAAVWEARKRLHRQGFGTHPVDDILEQIPEELVRLKKETSVTALISKWDEVKLAEHPEAQKVDVTETLIGAFHPNERQRRYAIEIQKQAPVPAVLLELMIKREGH